MLCKIINLGKGESKYFIILPYTYTMSVYVGICIFLHKYGTFQNDERQLSLVNWQPKQGNMKFQTSYPKK
jgi:hypothetical protein